MALLCVSDRRSSQPPLRPALPPSAPRQAGHSRSSTRDHCPATAQRILDGLYPDGALPKARIAVSGWLWFMDGACLNWVEARDISRVELRDLLLGVLMGSLVAADAMPLA